MSQQTPQQPTPAPAPKRPTPYSAGGPQKLTFVKLGLVIAFMGLLAVVGTTIVMVRIVGGMTEGVESGLSEATVQRPPVLIQRRGEHVSPDGRFTATVMFDQTGGVRYSVLTTEGLNKLVSAEIADASAPWALCWDREGNLWVYADGVTTLHQIVTTIAFQERDGWADDPQVAPLAPAPLTEWIAQQAPKGE